MRPLLQLLILLGCAVLTNSCFHEPTERRTLLIQSEELYNYKDGDSIDYEVQAEIRYIKRDGLGVPEIVLKNPDPPYDSPNCIATATYRVEAENGFPCIIVEPQEGTLHVEWSDDSLIQPVNNGPPLPVLKETWTLNIPHYPPNAPGPIQSFRYIQQTGGGSKYVVAYADPNPLNLNQAVATNWTQLPNQAVNQLARVLTNPSPIQEDDRHSVEYKVLNNCNSLGCVKRADATANLNVDPGLYIENYPILNDGGTQVFSASYNHSLGNDEYIDSNGTLCHEDEADSLTKLCPVSGRGFNSEMGLEFWLNCHTESGHNDPILGATTSGNQHIFPALGVVWFSNRCSTTYWLSFQANGAAVLVGNLSTDSFGGKNLMYQWTLESGPLGSSAVIENATAAGAHFYKDLVGEYRVRLRVSEINNIANFAEDVVYIYAVNELTFDYPIADAGDYKQVEIGASTRVVLNGENSSGLIVTYQWELTKKPANSGAALNLATSNLASTSFDADIEGVYEATLTITDQQGLIRKDTVIIRAVAAGSPLLFPVANAGRSRNELINVESSQPISTSLVLEATVSETNILIPGR